MYNFFLKHSSLNFVDVPANSNDFILINHSLVESTGHNMYIDYYLSVYSTIYYTKFCTCDMLSLMDWKAEGKSIKGIK